MNTSSKRTVAEILNSPAVARRRQWRMLKDKIARHSMTIGGVSVIFAIVLIFFYLLYVVFPLLLPASMEEKYSGEIPAIESGQTLYLAAEEKNEIGVRFTDQAHVIFFKLADGTIVEDIALNLPKDVTVTSFGISDLARRTVAFGLSNGRALITQHNYRITYPNDERVITPYLKYPTGQSPITIDEDGNALTQIDVQVGEEEIMLAVVTADNRLILSKTDEDDETTINDSIQPKTTIKQILLDKELRFLYIADTSGYITQVDVFDLEEPDITHKTKVVEGKNTITALSFLTGDISLLIGDSSGKIAQWFPAQLEEGGERELVKIREFQEQQSPITTIAPEERRKGFLASDTNGNVAIYHTTAHRTLLIEHLGEHFNAMSLSPRADVMLAESKTALHVWDVHNEHPEISISALWEEVWYESHDHPKYMWQSSSASEDFEPKFSLMPLTFGTLKAAFYAMLIAVPLAIFGAIYTAYFMTPALRTVVKPSIEIMQALPTVVLGFLAGLWLAPVIETNLPGFFALFIFVPLATLVFAYLWRFMPKSVVYRIPDGWEAFLLIPAILFSSWLAFYLSHPMENLFFNGDMRAWLNQIGIGFDQRNSLIVGITMGIAVIPNIFSITEDAIFGVPKHLTSGSLALGATTWQTMMRVVILTASPGIFSAVMIGLGRAVGETMIVLMATGNTPIMDFNIFEGLRTLSANIAVEMPESEVGSTHYRILFLSGLVLFIFTFIINTLAEVVRQRLRRKYSTL